MGVIRERFHKNKHTQTIRPINHLQYKASLMAIEIVQPSVGLSNIAISETHGENSPYFAGWKAYDENPYHEKDNPSGVIQMGLAENQVNTNAPSPVITLKLSYVCMNIRDLTGLVLLEQVSLDLIEGYLETNQEAVSWGKNVSGFRENALFQDYHGLLTFRKVQYFIICKNIYFMFFMRIT